MSTQVVPPSFERNSVELLLVKPPPPTTTKLELAGSTPMAMS